MALAIVGAPVGPIESDEGHYYLRAYAASVRGPATLHLRGAVEEIEARLDQNGRPVSARRRRLTQSQISTVAKHEFHRFAGEVAVVRADRNDLDDLDHLLEDPAVASKIPNVVAGRISAAPDETPEVSLEWNEQRQRIGGSPLMLGAKDGRPSFQCLSLCVSLAQREFGLRGGDCRATKIRKRDGRAATAANAARIRLCVKAVIAQLAQSLGTDGRICKAEKSKTRDTSDTQFVAEGVILDSNLLQANVTAPTGQTLDMFSNFWSSDDCSRWYTARSCWADRAIGHLRTWPKLRLHHL